MNRAPTETSGGAAQYCTFSVAGRFFGIDVLNVQEVLRFQEVTPVPLAPAVIEGLINLRGQIVTAIDMRRRLGLPPRQPGARPMNIVVRTQENSACLQVDEIGDVLDVEPGAFELPPGNLAPEARELVRGVYKLKDRLLLVLNTERTLELHADEAGSRPASL
jgi:purine-binding chemotaxis protein CheW